MAIRDTKKPGPELNCYAMLKPASDSVTSVAMDTGSLPKTRMRSLLVKAPGGLLKTSLGPVFKSTN